MQQEIIDILVSERMEALEAIASGDEEYRSVRQEQMETSKNLERMGLSEDQRAVIDDIISKINKSGAVYGKIAFKQGLQDGARLVSELRGIII